VDKRGRNLLFARGRVFPVQNLSLFWGRRIEHATLFCGKRGTKLARFFQALVEVLRSRVRTAQVNIVCTKIFSLSFQRDPGRVKKSAN
jgi:hypothetical protein